MVEVDEKYNSKICEVCGILNNALSKSKRFKCPAFGHTAVRDLHAVRNIVLRYLTQQGITSPESLFGGFVS